jgi:hypothetical protein
MTPGEAIALQVEAEQYNLLEQQLPVPPAPKPEPVICQHPHLRKTWGRVWCGSCGVCLQ